MNNNKLRKRLHYISASAERKRTVPFSFSKRGSNFVKDDDHPNDSFIDFFDYEDDLSSITPSNELFVEDRVESDFEFFEEKNPVLFFEEDVEKITQPRGVVLEEKESSDSFLIMEPIDGADIPFEKEEDSERDRNASLQHNTKDVDFSESFIEISDNYCIYHLNSGNRCEHDKENGSLFCKIHQQI